MRWLDRHITRRQHSRTGHLGRGAPRKAAPRWDALEWNSEDRLTLDGLRFWLTTTEYKVPSTNEEFVLLKNRKVLESYKEVFNLAKSSAKLLEVGFFHGAAMVFYDLLLSPDKLVGIDQVLDAPILEKYISSRNKSTIIPYFGVDQQDKDAVTTILKQEFPGHDIDVVIDDASHEYFRARATFEVAFPYLRENGVYVIEDWGWAHWSGAWQDPEAATIPGPALSNLVFELVMIQASSPDVISALHIDPYRVAVIRGGKDLTSQPFEMNDFYLTRGKTLSLL
jgi:SAM-dependent methyltransferase